MWLENWHPGMLPGVSDALQRLQTIDAGQGASLMSRNNEVSPFPALGQVHYGRRYQDTGDTGFSILSER